MLANAIEPMPLYEHAIHKHVTLQPRVPIFPYAVAECHWGSCHPQVILCTHPTSFRCSPLISIRPNGVQTIWVRSKMFSGMIWMNVPERPQAQERSKVQAERLANLSLVGGRDHATLVTAWFCAAASTASHRVTEHPAGWYGVSSALFTSRVKVSVYSL